MNTNIYNPYVREELYHHGIAGQRWGKRNGPPYPLGAGDHSASEKKAGWRKSLDKRGQSDKPAKVKKDLKSSKKVNKLQKLQKTKFSGLSKEQKEKGKKIAIKALKIGGTIAAASAVTYFAVKASNEVKNYNKLNSQSDMLNTLKSKTYKDWDDHMKLTYDAGKKYGTDSFAYDMMRQGTAYRRATYDSYNREHNAVRRELEQNKVYKFKNRKNR